MTEHCSAPPHALSFFRITFGCILFFTWLRVILGAGELNLVDWLLFGGMLSMGFLIIIGASLRPAALVAAAAHLLQGSILLVAHAEASFLPSSGQAFLYALLLIVLSFSGADRAFSHRMFLQYGSFLEWEDVRCRSQQTLKLIITASYLCIGFFILWQPLWMSGTRLRSVLIGPIGTTFAARFAHLPISNTYWNLSLYPIKALFIMLPFCLWIQSIQKSFMLIGFCLHLLIGLFLGHWWFLTLAAGYPLFFDPDDAEALWENILAHLRFKKV